MAGELDGSGIGNEFRDPRFTELDAQIQAAKVERQQSPAKRNRRQHAGPALPREVRKEITRCAQALRQHRKFFIADAKLKDPVARALRSMLPPHRKRGRPGLDRVTKAIRLLKQFRRQYLHEKPSVGASLPGSHTRVRQHGPRAAEG